MKKKWIISGILAGLAGAGGLLLRRKMKAEVDVKKWLLERIPKAKKKILIIDDMEPEIYGEVAEALWAFMQDKRNRKVDIVVMAGPDYLVEDNPMVLLRDKAEAASMSQFIFRFPEEEVVMRHFYVDGEKISFVSGKRIFKIKKYLPRDVGI